MYCKASAIIVMWIFFHLRGSFSRMSFLADNGSVRVISAILRKVYHLKLLALTTVILVET